MKNFQKNTSTILVLNGDTPDYDVIKKPVKTNLDLWIRAVQKGYKFYNI